MGPCRKTPVYGGPSAVSPPLREPRRRSISAIFRQPCDDVFSGYRMLSRRFVKSFPASAHGFEIETELTVHALTLQIPNKELSIPYRERPADSFSKLRTYRDGFRILMKIIRLFKDEKPFMFFGGLALLFSIIAIILIWPILLTYLETGLVPRFPTAILSSALMILAFVSLTAGLILDTVSRGVRELKRLRYLASPGLSAKCR